MGEGDADIEGGTCHLHLTVLKPESHVMLQLEQMVLRAQLQLSQKAYVHHYQQHGVSEEYIANCVEAVQQVADDYASMSAAVRKSSTMGLRVQTDLV